MRGRSHRNWKWWAKCLFGAYGVAVGLFLLLMVVMAPFVGLEKASMTLFDNARPTMLALTLIGVILCYRYLK